MILDLDHTLGCGQVFRWHKEGARWSGVVGGRIVVLEQKGAKVHVVKGMDQGTFERYFRADDDLEMMYRELGSDAVLRGYFERYRGLRLVRQDPWECLASYVLATNANIPRIQRMVEKVCRTFGTELDDGRFSFPDPGQLLEGCERAEGCGLGYRCGRFIELAQRAYRGEFDLEDMKRMSYEDCAAKLIELPGVGPKVADCVSLFSLEHLEAFPVDVRIEKAMAELYMMDGNRRIISKKARERFGPWAGYAQEYIYQGFGEKVTGIAGTRNPAP